MKIEKIYIDSSVADTPEVKALCVKLNRPAHLVDDIATVYNRIDNAVDPVREGKQLLYLTRNKGAFIKECPGTQNYICCGYKILHIGTFCTMDCSYCILQSYFHPPMLSFFVNYNDMKAELEKLFASRQPFRIGTGEFTDSMIWEGWTGLSQILIPLFSRQNRGIIELKTKTTAIEALEKTDHNRKTILAWSLNTGKIIESQERGTASLKARLTAAKKCQSWGYPLAFHFDPMVLYHGAENDYIEVFEMLFSHIRPRNIAWISLGTFRFMPSLKPIIAKRFPDSKIIHGEFIRGLDGKMRYFKPLRIEFYRKMTAWFKNNAPEVRVYFCMEDDEVWEKTLGFVPEKEGGLSRMLDMSAKKICGLE